MPSGSLDEWLSQRSAKPCTAVRIRQEPHFTEKINCYGSLDEWLSQRSAKPCTAVRIRQEPQTTSNALLAQLVEQLTLNQWVQGSNP